MTDEKRQGARVPIGLRVRLRFTSIHDFIAGYASNISRSGVFLEGVAPRPVDTLVRFELLLGDGNVALRGEGTVIWARSEGAQAGVAVRFTKLDSKSKTLIDELMARSQLNSASVPPPPMAVHSNPTRITGRLPPGSVPSSERQSHGSPVLTVAIKPAVARASRPSMESLELELETLSKVARMDATRASRPSSPNRRSVEDLAADLERLSDELSIPTHSRPAPKPVIQAETAQASSTRPRAGISVPPASGDYADMPAVLSLMGDDGEIRSALMPPAPHEAADAEAHAGGNIDAKPLTVPPESMREPTPVPEPGDEDENENGESARSSFIVIPQAPAMPRADVAASMRAVDDLPDLELGDMAEPSALLAAEAAAAEGAAAEELDGDLLEAEAIDDTDLQDDDFDEPAMIKPDPSRRPMPR